MTRLIDNTKLKLSNEDYKHGILYLLYDKKVKLDIQMGPIMAISYSVNNIMKLITGG